MSTTTDQKILIYLRKIGFGYASFATIGGTLFVTLCCLMIVTFETQTITFSIGDNPIHFLLYSLIFGGIATTIVGIYFIYVGFNYEGAPGIFGSYMNLLIVSPGCIVFGYYLIQKKYWIIETVEIKKSIACKNENTKNKIKKIKESLDKDCKNITGILEKHIQNPKNENSLLETQFIYGKAFYRAKYEFNIDFQNTIPNANGINDINGTFAGTFQKENKKFLYHLGIYIILNEHDFLSIYKMTKLFKEHKKWSNTMIMVLIYGRRVKVIFSKK